jgi:hypothetical protein
MFRKAKASLEFGMKWQASLHRRSTIICAVIPGRMPAIDADLQSKQANKIEPRSP